MILIRLSQLQQILDTCNGLYILANCKNYHVTIWNSAATKYFDEFKLNPSQLKRKDVRKIFQLYYIKSRGEKVYLPELINDIQKHNPKPGVMVYKDGQSESLYKLHLNIIGAPPGDLPDVKPEMIAIYLRPVDYQHKMKRNVDLFVHTIGHELKQPLGLIRAYTYYLQSYLSKKNNTTLQEYPQKINSQVSVLVKMLNDIVDTSKVSIKALKINPKQISLNNLMDKIVNEVQIAHPERKIQVTAQEDITISVDPIRFRQVIMNLILNAIKYSPLTSPVKLQLRKSKKHISIAITDHGDGIPEKDLPHIFDPYYRSTKNKKNKKGLGLGLALVKAIVDQHGGTIEVKSKVKNGSTFTIKIPV